MKIIPRPIPNRIPDIRAVISKSPWLSIAADYGGRWDILQAANQLIAEGATEITEEALSRYLMLGEAAAEEAVAEIVQQTEAAE